MNLDNHVALGNLHELLTSYNAWEDWLVPLVDEFWPDDDDPGYPAAAVIVIKGLALIFQPTAVVFARDANPIEVAMLIRLLYHRSIQFEVCDFHFHVEGNKVTFTDPEPGFSEAMRYSDDPDPGPWSSRVERTSLVLARRALAH